VPPDRIPRVWEQGAVGVILAKYIQLRFFQERRKEKCRNEILFAGMIGKSSLGK
jgi:hypothetical protein